LKRDVERQRDRERERESMVAGGEKRREYDI